jgi:hypothetical protein
MEDYKKSIVLLFLMVFILSLGIIFISKDSKKESVNQDDNFLEELHVNQIYFKNIQVLDELAIDQSLLIQDEVTYFFIENNENVNEVEIVQGSLEQLEEYTYRFKIKYEYGILEVYANKDKIDIQKNYEK